MTKIAEQKNQLAHTQRHLHELETLYNISQILAIGSNQRQILAETLDMLDHELGMRHGTILLLAPNDTEINVEVAHNLSEKQRQNTTYRMGEGVTGKVIQNCKAAIVPKISQDPMFLDRRRRKKITRDEISFICVPIAIDNKALGAISADRIFDESAPLAEDVRFLSIVASMIANNIKSQREAVAQRQLLQDENLRLRTELEDRFRPENIIGNSSAMRDVYQGIHQVAHSDTTVLIRGESGTGKELVAHAIHYSCPRAKKPFIKVNCAALSENLLESELFGHE